VNRLSISTLSIVFGPILFQSLIDHSNEPSSGAISSGLGWFSKQPAQNVNQEAMQLEQLRLDNVILI
jgi:hypothetical protein